MSDYVRAWHSNQAVQIRLIRSIENVQGIDRYHKMEFGYPGQRRDSERRWLSAAPRDQRLLSKAVLRSWRPTKPKYSEWGWRIGMPLPIEWR